MIAAARPGIRKNASTRTTFADDFNRADSTTALGNGWLVGVSQAPTWTPIWGITSNTAYLVGRDPAHGSGTIPYAYRDVGTGDVDVSVTFSTLPATNEGLLFRLSTDANTYWYVTATTLVRCRATIDGDQIRASWSTFAAGDTARVVASGSSITIYKNGVNVATVTDSTGATNTRHGLLAKDTGGTVRFDDFSITY